VLLPYCIWSIIYILLGPRQPSISAFIKTAVIDIIDGRASYQLYYILLTIQFYILFPLFLPLVGYIKKHPWVTLSISFVLELLILYVDYHTLQHGVGLQNPFWNFIAQYQNSIVLIYQFYFVLGAVVALYLKEIRSFLQRYGWWTVLAFLVGLVALWIHFFVQLLYYKESMGFATSVLQPIMTFYSLGVIAFAFWLAYRWAKKVDAAGHPRGYRIWHVLSDASFGIYLIHALFLNWYLQTLVHAMPQIWPGAIRVFLTWFITAFSATLLSIILMNIPVLSRLVGREGPALSLRPLKGRARKTG
jgi:peptidoglycan/LPS O-acetylase OafA/YrhL